MYSHGRYANDLLVLIGGSDHGEFKKGFEFFSGRNSTYLFHIFLEQDFFFHIEQVNVQILTDLFISPII